MIINCILLALSASIDALSIGVTYGIKNTKMSKNSNLIVFTIVFFASLISVLIGHSISILLTPKIAVLLGASLLIILGIYNIYKVFNKVNNLESFDLDNSNNINSKEATMLAVAVAIDAACVSLSSGIIGYGCFLLPIFMALFHTFFVNCGNFIAANIIKRLQVSEHILSFIAGTLLILIGIFRII